jgi:hypothetical protein
VDLLAHLTLHLQALDPRADADADGVRLVRDIADGLGALVRGLATGVPSCLSASIVLHRPGGDITVTVPAPTAEDDAAPVVRASLAVPLQTAAGRAVLVLQAAHAGAFVLLADDLQAQRHPRGLPALLDQHLVLPVDPSGAGLVGRLADLRVIEQAIGALIDQGWLPEQARQELEDRARAAQLSVPDLARQLLAALPGVQPPSDE